MSDKQTRKKLVNPSEIVYEKDVPIPEDGMPVSGKVVYPVHALQEKESFSYPLMRRHNDRANQLSSVRSAIRNFQRKHPDRQFIARMCESEGVIRVWRINDKTSTDRHEHA